MATSSGCFRISEDHRWRRDEHVHEDGYAVACTDVADSHDLIRVHGARENNLKDVSVELPKRRLTVFTGVSGSGKSSLVFDTIAAESQRLINETYSAFVQGFMPTLYDDTKSLNEGAITVPGYTRGGWNSRLYIESGFVDPDKPIRTYTKKELHDFLRHEPVRMKIAGINMTYEGLIVRAQRSMLSKDKESMQPHIRAFVDRAVTFTACPECASPASPAPARARSCTGRSPLAQVWCRSTNLNAVAIGEAQGTLSPDRRHALTPGRP